MRDETLKRIHTVGRLLRYGPVLITLGMPGFAQKSQAGSSNPLEITLSRSKVVIENGKEVSKKADVAKPGDVIEDLATYRNTSGSALKDFVPMLPVPPNTELILGSVNPGNAKASTDGRTFSDMPLRRKVRQANGVELEQLVPLSEYRYLRWYPGEIGAGKSQGYSARFKLSDGVPGSPVTAQK
ncbi:MAG: hypothetical protein JNK75_06300 [Betaproteobacteria bacterium]|nr:hypothetical protein [Betaproteobacteria bacterium]